MIIYHWASPDKLPVAQHTLICAPAGHLPKDFETVNKEGKREPNSDWWDMTGDKPRPRQFEVLFVYGEAEVPDALGRYLVETGQAQRTRLIVPNAWNR